jgi:hypothetical protein
MTDEFIAITDLLPALRDMCGALPEQLNYRRLLVLSQSGKITPPMRRRAERFWGCNRYELSILAERLGLAPKPAGAIAEVRYDSIPSGLDSSGNHAVSRALG